MLKKLLILSNSHCTSENRKNQQISTETWKIALVWTYIHFLQEYFFNQQLMSAEPVI